MADRIGLALSSGAARGWAHIGVIGALEAAGISPDVVCGTSIGAVIAALHAVGRLREFEAFVRRLNGVRLSQYFDFNFGGGGIIAGKRVLKVLSPVFGDIEIERMEKSFGCIATDLMTGDEVWLKSGKLLAALRASYAIPGLFPPAHIDGRWLMDGALVNPVPVSLCRALGAAVVIAVDVNAGLLGVPRFEEDEPALGERTGLGGWVVRSIFGRRRGVPSPFGVVSRTLQISQTRLARIRLAEDPPAIVIRPDVGRIGPFEFHRAADAIAAGEAAVRRALPEIHAAIEAAERAGPHERGGAKRGR